MTVEEANIIIAEFMGLYPSGCGKFYTKKPIEDSGCHVFHIRYAESLDALLPVWGRLEVMSVKIGDAYGINQCQINAYWLNSTKWSDGKTAQEAACIATAKCILEIKGEG